MSIAHDTGIDRVEIRRKNFIPADAFPYQTPVALQYDSGDYQTTLAVALKNADWAGFEARRADGQSSAANCAASASRPTWKPAASRRRPSSARSAPAPGCTRSPNIRVHPTGSVTVFTGTHSHGQGHETTLAQLVVDQLGVPFDQVEVVHGDTAKIPFGMGTYGSRSLAVGGSAMVKAMDKIIAKGKKIAAHLMEASVEDIEFADNTFTVAGTDKSKTLTDISLAAYVPHNYPIEELEPGLDETAFYDPKNFTFPGGCHIAEVEIDPETGVVEMVELHRRRRRRPRGQSDDRRGPGAGRRRPGHRPGAAGSRGLRRRRAAAVRLVHGLHDAARRQPARTCRSPPRTPCARTIRSARRAAARSAPSAHRRR